MSAVRIKRVCLADKRTIVASKNSKRKGGYRNRGRVATDFNVKFKDERGDDPRTHSDSGQGRHNVGHSDPSGQRVARDRRAVGLGKKQDRGSGNNRSERGREAAKSPRRDRQSSRLPDHRPKKTPVWDTNSSFDSNPFDNTQLQPARMIDMPMNALDFGGGGVQPGSYLVVLPAADAAQFQAAQQSTQLSIMNAPTVLTSGMESHFPTQGPSAVIDSRRFEQPSRFDFKVNESYQDLRSGQPPPGTSGLSPGRSNDRSYSSSMEYNGLPIGEDAILRVPYCRACKEYIAREKDVEAHLRSEGHFRKYFAIQTGGQRSLAVQEKVQQTDDSRQVDRIHSDSPLEIGRHHASSNYYEYNEDMRSERVRRDPSPPFHSTRAIEEGHGSQGQTLRRSSRERSPPRRPQWEEDSMDRIVGSMDRNLGHTDRNVGHMDRNVGHMDRNVSSMDRKVDMMNRDAMDRKPDPMNRKLDRYHVSDRTENRPNTSISFSSSSISKTVHEDWNSSRSKRGDGDYGHEIARGSRGYDTSEDSSGTHRCRLCGLGGIHDLSKHMRTIHFEDVVLRR